MARLWKHDQLRTHFMSDYVLDCKSGNRDLMSDSYSIRTQFCPGRVREDEDTNVLSTCQFTGDLTIQSEMHASSPSFLLRSVLAKKVRR